MQAPGRARRAATRREPSRGTSTSSCSFWPSGPARIVPSRPAMIAVIERSAQYRSRARACRNLRRTKRTAHPGALREKERLMGIEVGGILGLIILVLDVWAIVKIIGSSAGTGSKVLWIVIILLLPVLGLILWFLLGPKS